MSVLAVYCTRSPIICIKDMVDDNVLQYQIPKVGDRDFCKFEFVKSYCIVITLFVFR